jgi:hypothetical protein
MTLQADEIKRLAAGHCCQILRSVCGLTDRQLNPKVHGPCPRCEGKDRFRAFDDVNETGGLLCNQCGIHPDLFSSIQWLKECSFEAALQLVAAELREHGNVQRSSLNQTVKPKKNHATSEQAADALAWSMANNKTISEQRSPDSEWRYFNADGSDAGIVYRWNLPDGRKEVRQVSRIDGGWVTSAMPEPRPLYRLLEIITADEVWICEGEKAADAAVSLGLQATTSAGGSGAAEKSDWQPLDGKRVYILPDNDEPGEKFTKSVVTLLHIQAPNATVEVKRLKEIWPEIPHGGDVFDWSEHFDGADQETLLARLLELPDRSGDYVTFNVEASQNEELAMQKLVFHDGWKAAEKPRKMRECIIEGMLRRGEVGNFIASTKTGKSWFALMLLICVATGRDWLGKRVARGNVLLIDNELHEETIENRIHSVHSAMKIDPNSPRDSFEYVACRGDWISIQDLIEIIPAKYPPGSLNLIVIDAKYRLFGKGLEENSNDDQTTFHNLIDQFAKSMNCPIVLVHHSTKGDQAGKSVTDLGSGGGSQSRTVDLHMVIRPHQQSGLAVLEGSLRSFMPIEPITLRWNWPLWSVANDVEPVLPRSSKDAARYAEVKTKVLKHLADEWQSLSKLAERCSTKKDRSPFIDIVKELQREELIEINEKFIPKNSSTETIGIRMTSDKSTSDGVSAYLSERPN